MQRSMGLMLILGIIFLCGVFVIADGLSAVKEGEDEEVADIAMAGDALNGSVQGEVLVRFDPDLWNMTVLQSAASAAHASIGATVKTDYNELGLPGLQLVKLPPGMTVNESIAYYQSLPYVKYAEPNLVYSIESDPGQNADDVNVTGNVTVQNETVSVPIRLLVQFDVNSFRDSANLSSHANQTHALLNATLIKDFTSEGLSGLHLVELSGMSAAEAVRDYKNQTAVIYAEPDYEIRIDKTA